MSDALVRLDVDEDGVAFCLQFDVTFRGRPQRHCLIADVERGYVKRYRTLFGVLAYDRAGRPMTEELYGPVTITRRSGRS